MQIRANQPFTLLETPLLSGILRAAADAAKSSMALFESVVPFKQERVHLQEEVFKEAQTCLGDANRRLENAVQDLEELLKVEEESLKDAPDLEEAKSLLEQYASKDDDA